MPAPATAFANGVMARGIDMGDFESLMKGRPCNGVEPSDYAYLTALGIAAKTVTGREFIVAYLIGSEMSVRVSHECRRQSVC